MRAKLEALMRSMNLQEGSSSGKGKKDMKDHKFWSTQPVPKHDEQITTMGPIEPSIPVDQVSKVPAPLPKEFEWCELDMNVEKDAKELYDLLTLNYIEDDDEQFRFDYSISFLKWALQPPNWRKEWLVGVRVASNKKLVAFISAIPIQLRTFDQSTLMTDINFLNVHKKLRSKRLAPVMIREITRRSHINGIFQAVYTAGAILPKPISTCQYFHRSLNPKKLVECGFSRIPHKWTLARMIKHFKVPEKTSIPGFREMQQKDVPEVRVLVNKYMERFDFAPVFETDQDVEHWILPHKEVVWSYVVEDPKTNKITDMISFYSLPSSVIGNPKHKTLNAAYLYYYATDVINATDNSKDDDDQEPPKLLGKRLNDLVGDVLVMAKRLNFDVMNGLQLMDNGLFLQQQKFGAGDGYLNYYLYNWRCPDVDDSKVGLVML
ncbi:acyl-CoA N-acyltransferase [Halteromyces radiatus]|uniref:acyl-CoA N-acyltransferase n=1 Tax=Halteromyces radiatus TaxID=101107 RepID=UPI00221EE91D|nr:acyl-CoA N-acyltransferase [Halteromyces radiatus]KAI8096679.1 acyl-CoA N-acyltransferase [Halteromyces radiatus]